MSKTKQTRSTNFWRSRSRVFLVLNLLFIVAVFIIGFWPEAYQPRIGPSDISYYNGKKITIIGRICEEADVDYKSRRLNLCISGKNTGQILITTDLYPEYNYGDFVKVVGLLESPPLIDGFDYETYLARYDIYSVMYYPKISITEGNLNTWQNIYLKLIKFKWKLKEKIDSNLPEPEAGLADALLLGYRRTVMREDLQIFSRVGLSHMIAISGSHITILSAMIINFFLALGISRRRALKVIFVFLFLYPLITGLAASAVRSAIMGGLVFLALYYSRLSSLIKALVFSASLMLMFNQKLLRDDIGFQLSFAALLGIIYIYPIGEKITSKYLEKLKLKRKTKIISKTILDTINLTLVSQIIILPIALINFKQFSLIAPLANVLVLWTFPPLLASLIIGIFLSFIIPFLSVLWFFPSYLLLKYIFVVSSILATPSWAAVNIANFNWYLGTFYYLILVILIRKFKH